MVFLVTMVVSLLDPLRLATAIGSGFIPQRMLALVVTVGCSLGWTAFAAFVAAEEQRRLGTVHWIAPVVSALLLTALVYWLRRRKKPAPPSEPAT